MASDNRLELVVEVDTKGANRSLGAINSGLSDMERAAARGAGGAASQLNRVERQAQSLTREVSGLGRALAALGLLKLSKDAIVVAADFERGRLAIEAFVGSAEKAHTLFRDIQTFAEQSPFDFKDLMDSAQRLLAFNFPADNIVSTLRGVSSAVGALAGDKDKLHDVITALGQIRNASKLTGEELRQLRNAGLEATAFEALAKAYGKSVQEIQKLQREGLIPGLQAADIIVAGMAEKFQKFDEAVSKSASVAISNFRDALMRLADEVARDLLPDLTRMLNSFRQHIPEIAQYMREAVGVAHSLAQNFAAIGMAFVTYKIVQQVVALTAAVRTFNLVSMGTPWGLIAGGIALVGTELYRQYQQMREIQEIDFEDNAIRQLLRDGKTVKDLEKLGVTVDKVKRALGKDRDGSFDAPDLGIRVAGFEYPGGNAPPPPLGGADPAELEKRAREILARAQRQELTGLPQVREEYRQYRAEIGKTAEALDVLAQAEAISARVAIKKTIGDASKDQRKWAADLTETLHKENEKRVEYDAQTYRHKLEYEGQWATQAIENQRELLSLEERRAGYARDDRMLTVEAYDARTIEQKAWVEQQKMQIEVDYLEQVHAIRQRMFDAETSQRVLDYELEMKRLGYRADEIQQRIAEYTQQQQQIREASDEETDAAVHAARENAANRTASIIRDHNQRIFDSLKQQAGGVFDALLTKSQSVWSAIGNSFKTVMLTAIKEVVTSHVARMLMGLFGARSGGGGYAPGGAAGGGGWAGALGGFGSMFAGGAGGAGGASGWPGIGGGSMPPVFGGSATGNVGGAGSGGFGGLAGMSGMLGNLKDFAGIGGSVATGAGTATTWGAASMGQKLSSIGKSNAALMGGSLLAMDGLRRGGWLGLAETTGGGALIGFKFGGPLGAAIGAGIGAAAGVVRMFIKGAQEKAREKIKAVYGVDISDKGLLKQIVDTAKSAFGGNLDLAIRSPQVREIIELYAMSTGQKATGLPGVARASTLVQSGGSMYEATSFSNGSPLPSSGGLDSIGAGRASIAPPMAISLNIDGKAVGAAVIQNGRVVVEGAISALKGNAGRRQLTALQMSPGTIVS